MNLNDAFVKFDPNIPESHEPFATFAPGREMKSGGAFKQHRTRGAAVSAVAHNRSRIKLYEWNAPAQEWAELAVFDMHNKPDNCSFCGVRFMTRPEWDQLLRDVRSKGQSMHQLGYKYFVGCNDGNQCLDREPNGRLVWPPAVVTVCSACKQRRRLK